MSTNNDGTALEALKLTLNEIQSYLILLAKARQRLRPWIFANQQKDRFAQLNAALDKALAMFSATKILSTAEDVRATACHVGVLVSTVERLNSDAKSTLMALSGQSVAAQSASMQGPRIARFCTMEPPPAVLRVKAHTTSELLYKRPSLATWTLIHIFSTRATMLIESQPQPHAVAQTENILAPEPESNGTQAHLAQISQQLSALCSNIESFVHEHRTQERHQDPAIDPAVLAFLHNVARFLPRTLEPTDIDRTRIDLYRELCRTEQRGKPLEGTDTERVNAEMQAPEAESMVVVVDPPASLPIVEAVATDTEADTPMPTAGESVFDPYFHRLVTITEHIRAGTNEVDYIDIRPIPDHLAGPDTWRMPAHTFAIIQEYMRAGRARELGANEQPHNSTGDLQNSTEGEKKKTKRPVNRMVAWLAERRAAKAEAKAALRLARRRAKARRCRLEGAAPELDGAGGGNGNVKKRARGADADEDGEPRKRIRREAQNGCTFSFVS
ncbi:hypothetical protein DFH09DRAFT_1372165 [Mycena vulgaris]|nr:hypothetical protein DFH09DRAFT_1372165 [Mycena vulgaris]